MSCSCKHLQKEIEEGRQMLAFFRKLFVSRMTIDSEHSDRRRKDYNQAIFHYESDESVDEWNKECERFGLSKKQYGKTYAAWSEMDMDMVLRCFDDAVKDWRESFCDTEGCRRKR